MELASASLKSYNAFSVPRPLCTSRNLSPSQSFLFPSVRNLQYVSSTKDLRLLYGTEMYTDLRLLYGTVGSPCSSVGAVISNTTAITNDSAEEHTTISARLNPTFDFESSSWNEEEQEDKGQRFFDKLINIFLVEKPNPSDWRRLLIFNKQWSVIRPNFHKWCHDQVDNESDPAMKHKLLRLARKLNEIDDDVQRHNQLLDVLRKSSPEVGEIVVRRRKDFTKEFFVHLQIVADSYFDNPTEQNAVLKLREMCLAAVDAYDTANENLEAISNAELKLQDIINSPSLDAACRKIDNLVEKNELDPALVLMITKAWSDAKETNVVEDEVKDIMFHLYKRARASLQRLIPKELRILKYLLRIKSSEKCISALRDAFTPGEESEGENIDFVYTTPEQLHGLITTVIDAYKLSKTGSLIKQARDMMNPKTIKRLERLRKLIQHEFL